jgi:ABC-type nitrate/sulfonate/bicarbonate transport system substrate-binding protein
MRLGLCLLFAIALILTPAGARADEPVKLRIGWITVPIALAPIMATKQDVTRHFGKSYTLEPIHFAGSTPQITALASGDLDIAELSYSSFALAIQNAHLDDLRMIADSLQDGVNAYSGPFVVRKDGPVKTIEDLKGKTVAVNVIGAGIDIGMRAMLRRHGLEAGRDYNQRCGAAKDRAAAVRSQRGDGRPNPDPDAGGARRHDCRQARGLRRFFRGRDSGMALVSRSQESRCGAANHRRFQQEAGGFL